jgi:uridine phosphorylase
MKYKFNKRGNMAYPNYENKHLEESLFSAVDFIKWREYKKKKGPTKYLIIYYPYLLNYFKNKYHPKKIRLYRLLTVYQYKNMGVIQMTGIGGPNAATVLEEAIALGGKEFLNIGSAGGLHDFGIFLCDRAVRDEGTSHHYIAHGKYSYPDKKLTEKLGKYMKKQGLEFETATTWTIDAPYRETKAEIQHYKKEGVKTVEMEASALFAVAQVRKVKIASAFVISDVLGEKKWDPQFDAVEKKKKLKKLLDAAVNCLIE